MQFNRYEMLTKLHEVVKPRTYLEIGVQTGASFTLAKGAQRAIGVDPDYSHLTFDVNWPHALLVESTSDAFFAEEPHFVGADGLSDVDLVFIDGMHRVENVARDFINSVRIGHADTVYVFDDVLPRNNEEAGRDMIPGDWTGDVYKIIPMMEGYNMWPRLVDTFPTGMLVAWHLGPMVTSPANQDAFIANAEWFARQPVDVPQAILDRAGVTDPQTILDELAKQVSRG